MADVSPSTSPPSDLWDRAVGGDRDAFEEALEPHNDTLVDAARRKIAARIDEGELRDGALTPEELAGETLIRAFDRRKSFDPDQMSFRAWLLGLQYRTLNRLVRDEHRYDDQKAISLDAEVPTNEDYDAVEEDFYEFRQPFDVTTYEEMIPSQQPEDVEIDASRALSPEERDYLDASGLEAEQRHLIEFHDEFELSLSEIAQIMEYSLQDTAEALGEAQMHVRQYIGSTDVDEVAEDEPVDSYTGEPIRENPTQPDTAPAEPGAPTDSDHENANRA
jgi:DNA-directed RNA polymerase specialized sigma24 family protein